VRRRAQHRRAFARWRVAAAHGSRDAHGREAHLLGDSPDLAPRLGQVLVDVRRQGLERGDVDHPHFVGQLAVREALAQQLVERDQERRERLSGAGRCRDQRVLARRIACQPSSCASVGGRTWWTPSRVATKRFSHQRWRMGWNI
jgi:hypothetical protein